ncbi:MAG: hypothetical protein AB1405_18010, partial [Bdellovibrionota bacterium]
MNEAPRKIGLAEIQSRMIGVPLLMERRKMDVILKIFAPRMGFQVDPAQFDGPAYDAAKPVRMATQKPRPGQNAVMVGVIDIFGTLTQRNTGLDAFSGLTSYESLSREFNALLKDPAIGAIVLNVDSPGGEVAGAFDLADEIFQARGKKPILAFAHDLAASAAYLLASSA